MDILAPRVCLLGYAFAYLDPGNVKPRLSGIAGIVILMCVYEANCNSAILLSHY